MSDHLSFALPTLYRCDLCRGLAPDDVRRIAEASRLVSFPSGATICRQNEAGAAMYVVVRGRVKISVEQGGDAFRLLDYRRRGDHFGEMALLTDGYRMATATAVMECDLLEIDRHRFHELMVGVPGFAANLSRSLGFRLRQQSGRRARRDKTAVVAIVVATPRTRGLLAPLVDALVTKGESIQVLTDRRPLPQLRGARSVESTPRGGRPFDALRDSMARAAEWHDRVFVEVAQTESDGELEPLLRPCEDIWWLVDTADPGPAVRRLNELLNTAPGLVARTRLVWIMGQDDYYTPIVANVPPLAEHDFKVPLSDDPQAPTRKQHLGVQRLARHLRGVRIGIALGGGGARGLAHLGVLRALERAGIACDLLAGTSSGALMGLSYCAGWSPDDALAEFKSALTPPRWLRAMPFGSRWYMWGMFRLRRWEGKLRKYGPWIDMDQLQIPFYTVAVDMIGGEQVVNDRGDAINAVLDSINIPMISRPILRDGMALVDGGVLNNLPGDVLVDRGADFVIGVNVMSTLQASFAGNTPRTPTNRMQRPGAIEMLFRLVEVQGHLVTALRSNAIDVLIQPDTAAFEFADFTKAIELGEVGESAAEEAIPQIKQMLADLDG